MNHNPYHSDDSDAASADDCHTSNDDPSKDNSSEQGRLTIALSLLIFVCLFYHRLYITMFVESGKSQPDDVKLKLIELRVPEQSFKYPGRKYNDSKCKSGVYTRYCNRDWLSEFQFLSYSKLQDGLYSLSCILFPSTSQAQ